MNLDQSNVEPGLPPSGTRCTDVLSDTLLGYAGIRHAEFDIIAGKLNLDYDPRVLSDEQALRLVRRAGTMAWERVSHCAQRGDAACGACLAQMGAGLQQHYRRLASMQTAPQAYYEQGVMEIQLGTSSPPDAELSQAEKSFAAPAETPTLRRLLPEISRQQLEVAFTAFNPLTALAAFLGQQVGVLSPPLIAALYSIAYLTGGYYGMVDGLDLLRRRRLDVNLLMIMAALGAAIIGQPAEGAALLFLFSLSNTLQTYAMDRSRRAIEKLLDLRPPLATVRRGSRLVSLPVERLLLGDIVLVRPGERFPIDGEVIDGSSVVDQSAITGESLPVPKGREDQVYTATNFRAVPGQGVEAHVEGQAVWIGNERLFNERRVRIPEELREQVRRIEAQGQTVMLVNADGDWLGLLAVADSLRPNAAHIVAELKQLGVEYIVMLTGDNERVAAAIAEGAGVEVIWWSPKPLLPKRQIRL